MRKLIEEKILSAPCEPWQGFRTQQLWTIDVNDILDANQANLTKIFNSYFTAVKKYVTYEDIIDMVCKVCQMNISEIDVLFSFGMSKMAVTNEPQDYKRYSVMQFPEFNEFIGRLADAKFKNDPADCAQPLAWKVEQVLEELCPAFGLVKKDVNIDHDDNSESDDDY